MTESTHKLVPIEITVADQQQHGESFPLVIGLESEKSEFAVAENWVRQNKEDLLNKLSKHGAILLRGLPLTTDTDFDGIVAAFELKNFAYKESLSNAVRRNRTERVFTANEAPAEVSIYLHHEMAQTPIFPSKLAFFCEHPADEGGATPLCRSDVLLQRLEQELPPFIAKCEKLGVRYSNVMPCFDDQESGQGRSWQSTLNTDSKEEVETRLEDLDYEWRWLDDGSLRVTTPVLPIIRELEDGRRVFFNQLIAAYRGWKDSRNSAEKSIRFGDGSDFDTEDMATVIEISDRLTFNLNWQAGDVALVDNFLVMHGRRAFSGNRRILASLFA